MRSLAVLLIVFAGLVSCDEKLVMDDENSRRNTARDFKVSDCSSTLFEICHLSVASLCDDFKNAIDPCRKLSSLCGNSNLPRLESGKCVEAQMQGKIPGGFRMAIAPESLPECMSRLRYLCVESLRPRDFENVCTRVAMFPPSNTMTCRMAFRELCGEDPDDAPLPCIKPQVVGGFASI